MGKLQQIATGRIYTLAVRNLVGRAQSCDLILPDLRVSGEHAVVWWDAGWKVRDLGSRNGTFVDEQRIAVGDNVPLIREAKLSFGRLQGEWELGNDAAPSPEAVNPSGQRVLGEHGVLALPSSANPECSIFRMSEGQWVAEWPDHTASVAHDEVLTVAGISWTLGLPETLPATMNRQPHRLDDMTLHFAVTRDEEFVMATLVGPDGSLNLEAKAHHGTTLALARARLRDQRHGQAESTAGWMYQDDLAKGLQISLPLLNLHVHRARRQLADANVIDFERLFERRTATRQLRIGSVRVTVEEL